MIKQNLHTHTVYCDGSNTCEELIQAAIERGFSALGFSGHAYTPFDESYCMSMENTRKYCNEIDLLKKKYSQQIQIFKGIEYDLYSELDRSEFDYIIGSVHYVFKDGKYLPVDLSGDSVKDIINTHFNGNSMEYVRAYYEGVKEVPKKTNCDILGHFDLVTKFSDTVTDINPLCDEYLTYAYEAIQAVSQKIKVFEVNTGAMSRGYRNIPYPMINLMNEMKNAGMMPIITSDCHNKEHLDYGYDAAIKTLKNAGYTKILMFDGNNFAECSV
jgi:histidinol-phosphatase (PHP family)